MPESPLTIQRPQRWDVPFDPDMSDRDVDRLLKTEPLSSIDESAFPASTPLRGILRNDARLVRFDDGDLIVREGDYGSSAFLILDGAVRVTLQHLPERLLGRKEPEKRSLMRVIAQLWTNPNQPEVRDYDVAGRSDAAVGTRRHRSGETHVFLQDVPGVLDKFRTVRLGPGEMFGELAALARTPRTATVFADGRSTLLEIRWQGLRDLLRKADALREHVNKLYRERSLKVHLEETPLLGSLSADAIAAVADATDFETFGNFDWQTQFKTAAKSDDHAARLAVEPVIAEEGHYTNGLILIRSGFARLSRRYGHGHRTLSYLGKGQIYGLAELYSNWKAGEKADPVPLRHSLRAIGYVDILRIPTAIVEKYILPNLPADQVPEIVVHERGAHADVTEALESTAAAAKMEVTEGGGAGRLDTGFLEFLVERRLINGTQTMIIDLDRCVRCDDCVRACAATHDNNPRFIRHGPAHDRFMFTNACMHCADPVCMIGCPTGAIHRDHSTGNVIINDRTCIGCATCANSCPYSNIRMVEVRDKRGRFILDQQSNVPILKATKCDLAIEQPGEDPPCQRACPHDALRRVNMQNLDTVADWLNRA